MNTVNLFIFMRDLISQLKQRRENIAIKIRYSNTNYMRWENRESSSSSEIV